MPRPNRLTMLIFCQALLCWLEAYLISKISFIGRVGIATVHKEYKLLRSGWKTYLLLLTLQLVIIAVLYIIQRRYPRKALSLTAYVFGALALLGLLFTFEDFLHTYTHRLLKERFHLGFYLFWFGIMGTCVFFLLTPQDTRTDPPHPFPLDPNTPAAASGIPVAASGSPVTAPGKPAAPQAGS